MWERGLSWGGAGKAPGFVGLHPQCPDPPESAKPFGRPKKPVLRVELPADHELVTKGLVKIVEKTVKEGEEDVPAEE